MTQTTNLRVVLAPFGGHFEMQIEGKNWHLGLVDIISTQKLLLCKCCLAFFT